MDLEEWEVLSDDGYLEIHDDGGGNKIFSRKYASAENTNSVDFNNNYFICPSPKKTSGMANQLVLPPATVPIQLDQLEVKKEEFVDDAKKQEEEEEEVKFPSSTSINYKGGRGTDMETAASGGCDQEEEEAVSQQISFKKETNEFVDMKLVDSPTRSTTGGGGGGWGVMPQIEPPMVQFDKETGGSSDEEKRRRMILDSSDDDGINNNNNIWKWSCLHGIGAICSFGVAAATICIIILGSNSSISHKNNKQQNQKIRFQIYAAADDKRRIKQVVVEQASSKLNEAILAVRGVPLRRAHFTCGGYYDGATL